MRDRHKESKRESKRENDGERYFLKKEFDGIFLVGKRTLETKLQ
jgi:hypothetical protein